MSQARLRLFVGNLPWTVSRKQLLEYFSKFGPVRNAFVSFDLETGFSKGYGFVTFVSKEGQDTALALDDHVLENKKLHVDADQNYR